MELLLVGLGVLACPAGMAAVAGITWGVARHGRPGPARLARMSGRGCAMSMCHRLARAPGSGDHGRVEPPPTGEQTFVFADLAGFTALTEAHGDQHAADLALRFARDVDELLADHGAHRVKCIGDGVMIRVPDPAEALRLGLRIAHEIGARSGFPLVRVGIHTGPAVERDGDWYGAAVNLAARIAAIAEGGEVLLSDRTRRAAGEPVGVIVDELAEAELKNVARRVALFAARPAREPRPGLSVDPVCRMAVAPAGDSAGIRHEGVEYAFCSPDCREAFAGDPAAYLGAGDRPGRPAAGGGNRADPRIDRAAVAAEVSRTCAIRTSSR